MRRFGAERVDELVRVYREHNEPLHASSLPCAGHARRAPRAAREGRRLGIVTAKRRATVALAFDALPLEPLFDVVVAARTPSATSRIPSRSCSRSSALGADAADAAYVGDSPFDVRAARAAGVYAVAVGWGGIHDDERARARASRTPSCDTPGGAA